MCNGVNNLRELKNTKKRNEHLAVSRTRWHALHVQIKFILRIRFSGEHNLTKGYSMDPALMLRHIIATETRLL